MTSQNKAYLALIFAALIWGAQPLFIKRLIIDMTPLTLTCIRYLLMSLTLFLALALRGELRLPRWRILLEMVPMGFLAVSINNIVQFIGLQYSTVTNCTLISATLPMITALLALIFLRERLHALQWCGLLLALGGALYLLCKGSLARLLGLSFNVGDLYFFISQLAWSVYSLRSVAILREMPVMALVAWTGLFGGLMSAAYGALSGDLRMPAIHAESCAALAYTIWLGGVCAMICWNVGVKTVGPSRSAIFLNLMPLVGIALAVSLLDEPFGPRQILGAAGILGGVFLLTQCRHIQDWLERKKA